MELIQKTFKDGAFNYSNTYTEDVNGSKQIFRIDGYVSPEECCFIVARMTAGGEWTTFASKEHIPCFKDFFMKNGEEPDNGILEKNLSLIKKYCLQVMSEFLS